jgi:hypothetical protein
LGVDAQGKPIRRGVTAPTKTPAIEAMENLRHELGHHARRSSRTYTVSQAGAD